MDWQELFAISLGLALVIVPPILFARFLQWGWTRWKPKSEPRSVFVYAASFAVWFFFFSFYFFYSTTKLSSPPQVNLRMPAFPWPPPPASAETMIPRNWLSTTATTRLIDVADELERALKEAKYPMWSYSSVPNGFALVSQMEQIKSDGIPSPAPARWSTGMPRVTNMTLLEFIKALSNAQSGYYRVIVFIVTNQPWSRTGKEATGEEAEQWLAQGFNWLPPPIGELIYEPDYRTTVLVYEFKKVSQDASATFLKPSSTSADDHLKKAGLYDPLSQR
jgi:hypothetical protein